MTNYIVRAALPLGMLAAFSVWLVLQYSEPLWVIPLVIVLGFGSIYVGAFVGFFVRAFLRRRPKERQAAEQRRAMSNLFFAVLNWQPSPRQLRIGILLMVTFFGGMALEYRIKPPSPPMSLSCEPGRSPFPYYNKPLDEPFAIWRPGIECFIRL